MKQFLIQKVKKVLFIDYRGKGDFLNEHLYSERENVEKRRKTDIFLSPLESAIIKTLLYFDIFSYPLTTTEIVKYCSSVCPFGIGGELDRLVVYGLIGEKNGFYYLGDVVKTEKRIWRNANAKKYMPLAIKYSKWIGAIPFVQSVCISGSLSKMDMGERADIDYFVIVDENRVWIIRFFFSLMIKPLTMLGLRNKFLCPNYIIDGKHLEIRDKNIYTATEVVSLIPGYGVDAYQRFLTANDWVKLILPNSFSSNDPVELSTQKRVGLDMGIFNILDDFLFGIYKKHYKSKFYDSQKWKIQDFELKFSKFESKNHLNGYRNKILVRLDEGIAQFEDSFGVKLHN